MLVSAEQQADTCQGMHVVNVREMWKITGSWKPSDHSSVRVGYGPLPALFSGASKASG